MEPPSRAEWGPIVWKLIHLQAMSYADVPTDEDKLRAKNYFHALAKFLPCPECMEHFDLVLKALPIDEHLDSPKQLIDWTHAIHNRVNLQLGKSEITKQEFYRLFESEDSPGRKFVELPTFAGPAEIKEVPKAKAQPKPKQVPAKQVPAKQVPRSIVKQVQKPILKQVQKPVPRQVQKQVQRPVDEVPVKTKTLPMAGRRVLKIPPPMPVGFRATKGCTNCR